MECFDRCQTRKEENYAVAEEVRGADVAGYPFHASSSAAANAGCFLASHSSHFLSDDSVQNGHIYYDDNMDRYHSALKYADRQWIAEGSVQTKETPQE